MSAVEFQRDVLERSRAVPVVVDFWAPWCAPCRMLGPVLEELAREAAGRWELVKLDTDEQPDVATDYGVRGIPAVKMFHDGAVVAEFVGALPASEVRRWLASSLPDPRLGRLQALAAAWPARGAAIEPELETLVREEPDLAPARLALARVVAVRDPARARELVRGADDDADLASLAADARALADLGDPGEAAPGRLAPHLAAAREALAAHDLERALDALIDAALADKSFADELARRAAVALFHLLGDEHELTREYRRRLGMALHS